MDLTFELFVDVLAVLMGLVPAYYSYKLFSRDHSQKVWLVFSLALLLTVFRRSLTLFDYLLPTPIYNGLDPATDTAIAIASIALMGWCFWTIIRRYKIRQLEGALAPKMAKKKSSRGQGATEYIVLLAIVLMVALIVVGLLGFFPSFSTNTQVTEYTQYWAVQRPLAILDAAQLSTGGVGQNLTISIENHGTSSLTITKINVSLTPAGSLGLGTGTPGNGSVLSLAPGDRGSIRIFNSSVLGNTLGNCAGNAGKYLTYNVTVTYNQDPFTGKVETGSKPVAVLCT
ncbi:MAG: class III signal peptide-containing protein [Candidatus Micrarchaeota archaeon]|nr:class III signal peptide-containing protein [Candidatus Micrarchaeota archaeon]